MYISVNSNQIISHANALSKFSFTSKTVRENFHTFVEILFQSLSLINLDDCLVGSQYFRKPCILRLDI